MNEVLSRLKILKALQVPECEVMGTLENVTLEEILSYYPSDNVTVTVLKAGTDLLDIVENAFRKDLLGDIYLVEDCGFGCRMTPVRALPGGPSYGEDDGAIMYRRSREVPWCTTQTHKSILIVFFLDGREWLMGWPR